MPIIRLKRSTTSGNTPASLVEGELAINLVDRRLFAGNSSAIWDAFQNTSSNVVITTSGADRFAVGNSTVNASVNSTTLTIGANVTINVGSLRVGNSTANLIANSTVLRVGNSTVNNAINTSGFATHGTSYTASGSNNAALNVPNTLSIVCNTVNSSIVYTGQQNFLIANLTSTTNSIAWNLATAQVARHTATEHTTLAAPTNPVEGGTYVFIFKQHATSPRTLGFNAAYHFANTPTASAVNNAVDIMSCVYEGGVMRCVYYNGVT